MEVLIYYWVVHFDLAKILWLTYNNQNAYKLQVRSLDQARNEQRNTAGLLKKEAPLFLY